MNRRHVRLWPVVALSAAAGLLLFWHSILSCAGSLLVDSGTPGRADLILVLGGDFWGPRVLKAAELGRAGYAPLVLISGTPYGTGMEGEYAIRFLAGKGYPKEMFASFGHHARSTSEEAMVLRDELIRRRTKRVIFVTSAYHSRRAGITLRLNCPGVEFVSAPAAEEQYHPDRWWTDPRSRGLFFSEWMKILGMLLLSQRAPV